jgi:ABC-type polysaccharide/polyol phosphate transport system ATPase subunit/glycosyltransferase involved in cell wall biosynthesis
MDKDNVIEVTNLSKKFSKNIKSAKIQLKNIFVDTLFGLDRASKILPDEFYALKDISFSINQNENIAIIGSNGSGKSTLLKILNGIYTPDVGEVKIKGKVGSVLELSSGFKSELSGRENIYLKFALQGISKEEVDLIIDDVIAFSELENFMQTPLKHYSSGMKSKLGFAIVSSINPDILILDEVFAAGDKNFREKSEKRIKEIYKNSTTILVTHSMSIVKDIADRVIVLDKGKLVFDGTPQKGIAFYENMLKPKVVIQKVFSKNTYSVVTVVYNAEKYLDEYFKSLINQTLDFQKHIFLILVDDGSTDNSAEIIKKYQDQFPKNIIYIKNKHKGVSSARNLGLSYVKSPWVTFIDSQDFINNIYFEEVDNSVINDSSIGAVSCNKMHYINETEALKKTNISNRFTLNKKVVNPSNMQFHIEISVNSIFFKNSILNEYKLYFDEKIQPVFDDGCFTNNFFLILGDTNIVFLKASEYYERKNFGDSLELDHTWKDSKRYLDAIEYGLINLCEEAVKKYSTVPVYIQRYVLYHIQLYFKRVIDSDDNLNILTVAEKIKFQELIKKLFQYLDVSTIELSAFNGLSHKYRVGYYNLYKQKIMYNQVCYVSDYNEEIKELEVYYYYHSSQNELFTLNEKKLDVLREEIIEHKFLDTIFMYEKRIIIQCDGVWEYFDAEIGDVKTTLIFKNKEYKNGIQINTLKGKI